jgi:competence protein ComEC
MRGIRTRFRAYHLGSPGASFSYFADGHFTMIEARLTDDSREQVEREMAEKCGVDHADVLHITSWDADHCNKFELPDLLNLIRPMKIECPGYDPHKEYGHGEECLEIIAEYRARRRNTGSTPIIRHITPKYIEGLEHASAKAFHDTLYNPLHISENANDNSTVKLFRKGSFNVLSLGDVESPLIGARLRRQRVLRSEVDVMILAHHGADNGFTTKKFLNHIEPDVAICSSDYDNMYDHPREEIRELLHEQGIHLKTTKTGDVIIRSTGTHTGGYEVINLIGKSTKESSRIEGLFSKKSGILDANGDTLRQRYSAKKSWPR